MMDMLFFPVLAWLAWMVGGKVNAWATKSMDVSYVSYIKDKTYHKEISLRAIQRYRNRT